MTAAIENAYKLAAQIGMERCIKHLLETKEELAACRKHIVRDDRAANSIEANLKDIALLINHLQSSVKVFSGELNGGHEST